MSRKVRCLVLDPLPESALDIFTRAEWDVVHCHEPLSEGQLLQKLADFQILAVRKRELNIVTEEVLRSAHKLLAIGCFNERADQVDLLAAENLGIPVFYAPYGHSHSVAEFVICLIVSLARELGDRSREVHASIWNKKSSGCHEVRGKTLGLIGYGNIGSQVSVLGEAMGMRIIFYDIASTMPIGRSERCDSLESLLRQSDFLSIHVGKNVENRNLIDAKELALMKKGASIINCSYGEAININALCQALKSGHLSGAAIDVFPDEPLIRDRSVPYQSPLAKLPNVILTPQIAHATMQSRDRVGASVAYNLVRYVVEGSTVGSVNFPNIETRPVPSNRRRIVNIHRNVRGVMREISDILAGYNVAKQVLDTNQALGYVIADIEAGELATEVVSQLALLSSSVRTRII